MKLMRIFFLAVLATLLIAPQIVKADAAYPVNNVTYIPTAFSPPVTYTAPGSYILTTHNIGTATIRISGTCTGLTAVGQVSQDGINYTTINLYPVATGVITIATSATAPGLWRINPAGFLKARLSITALTASCTVQMGGTTAAFVNLP